MYLVLSMHQSVRDVNQLAARYRLTEIKSIRTRETIGSRVNDIRVHNFSLGMFIEPEDNFHHSPKPQLSAIMISTLYCALLLAVASNASPLVAERDPSTFQAFDASVMDLADGLNRTFSREIW